MKTLTIKGDGELTALSSGGAAGIGGGWLLDCGNIVLDGGTITAIGGRMAAGIGAGRFLYCCDITITNNVRKVTAIKGSGAPYSIGKGGNSSCGTITIGGKVTESIKESPYIYEP